MLEGIEADFVFEIWSRGPDSNRRPLSTNLDLCRPQRADEC